MQQIWLRHMGQEGKVSVVDLFQFLLWHLFLYVGFDCIPQAAEEYDFPPQKCKKLIISALIVGVFFGAV